jgi:hypothetical protein
MALMSPQAISSVITPSFAAPSVSDTITYTTGLVLYVKNGATSSTVTIVVPGDQVYSGTAKTDLVATFSNAERAFYISPEAVDPATGLVTVTYSSVATVTAALLKV